MGDQIYPKTMIRRLRKYILTVASLPPQLQELSLQRFLGSADYVNYAVEYALGQIVHAYIEGGDVRSALAILEQLPCRGSKRPEVVENIQCERCPALFKIAQRDL